jgi:hypothetical protein
MSSKAAVLRARLERLRRWTSAPRDARVRRNALAAVSATVAVALATVSGTTAIWTGSVTISPVGLTAGSVQATLTGGPGLEHLYTASALSKTAPITIGNAGSSSANYTFAIAYEGKSTELAPLITVTYWVQPDPAACTDNAPVGFASWSGKLDSVPAFTGVMPANTTATLCVRTRADAGMLQSNGVIAPLVSVSLVVPGTSWTSAASYSAKQKVVADPTLVNDYTTTVLTDGANRFWRLGESTGPVLYDWVGRDDAYGGRGLTRETAGALVGDPNTATTFPNDATGMAGTRIQGTSPQSFSAEAWFQTTTTTGGKILGFGGASSGASGNNDRHIYLDATGKLNFGVWPNSAKVLTTTGTYNDGQWHHVVASLGAAGQQLYVDGNRVGYDSTTTSALSYQGYWRIGGDTTWAGDMYFDGAIDDVAIYQDPLTALQVKTHWNLSGRGGFPVGVGDPYASKVYADSPTLYWRLGESSGTVAADSSSTGVNPGTYAGNVTKPARDSLPNTRNTAASFGGTDGTVISTTKFTNPQVYSLELWFNTTSTTGGKLMGFGDAPTGNSVSNDRHIYLQNDGKIRYGIADNGAARTAVTPASYNDGAWHHVVATQSAGGMIIYVDGTRVASSGFTTPAAYDGYWRIGGDTLSGAWAGTPTAAYVTASIDEVAVYPTELSETQVKVHYAAATGAPVARIVSTMSGVNGTFNGSSSTDDDGSITQYNWNFGDGGTSTGAAPSHSFTSAGVKLVWLTVVDNSGKTSTSYAWVTATDTTPPSAPGTPTVAGNTGTTVTLSWPAATDNVGVATYEIYRGATLAGVSNTTTFTDTGRALNTSYTYTVKAKDASGNTSAASGSVAVTTLRSNFSAGTFYAVSNIFNGKCLRGGDAASGDTLRQYTCATATNQNFQFVELSKNYFVANSRAVTSMAWDVAGSSTTAGARVKMATQHGGNNQLWTPVYQPTHDAWTFVNRNSGMCLQVVPDSTTDGLDLQQAVCAATTYQYFALTAAP